MNSYSFDTTNTSNSLLNLPRFMDEVLSSSLTASILGLDTVGTQATMSFQSTLSAEDITLLDALVAAHDGSPESETAAPLDVTVVEQTPSLPFAAKTLPDGSKLYERKHGVAGSEVAAGQSETTIFSVPYPACKITAVQVVGSKLGDQVDFRILDTPAGTVSTVPNHPLNQFGFGVYVTDGEFEEESRYDADLFLGLQLEMTYINNGSSPITPNYNVLLHELK